MANKFAYYGGKKITDTNVIKELQAIEESVQDDIDKLRIDGDIKCISSDGSVSYIQLDEQIGDEGGEGAVFTTNDSSIVAKLYWPRMCTKSREEKIKLMVDNPLNEPTICWPTGMLYHDNKFVGLVMPRIDSDEYEQISISSVKILDRFMNHDKRNVIKILINVMGIFDKLKKYNIVMGDVHPGNFMIKKDTYDVILIDLDGAQIDKYPCVACKDYYNAPELFDGQDVDSDEDSCEEGDAVYANHYYHQKFSTFHRDNFSIAVFAFALLMGVPKAYNNFSDLVTRDFGYHVTDEKYTLNHNKHIQHSARWAHLPYFIRETFCKCFTTQRPEKDRPTPKQWKAKLQYYLELLNDGTLKSKDKDCLVAYTLDKLDYGCLGEVKMYEKILLNVSRFTMRDAVTKLTRELSKLEEENHNIDTKMVSEYLKHNAVLNMNRLTFKVLFNIGVMKKISLEYVRT